MRKDANRSRGFHTFIAGRAAIRTGNSGNVPVSDHSGPNRLHFLHRIAAVAALGLASFVTACDAHVADSDTLVQAAAEPATADKPPPPETAPLVAYSPGGGQCDDDASLSGQLFGAVQTELDWQASAMSCDGMARPHGEGARMRFAGKAGDELQVAIIISMPSLEPGVPMEAVPSNVTVIEEGRGRFFSATDLETCWTDVSRQDGVDNDFRIEGVLYCISPLAEIGGGASITIDDIEFVGRLVWEAG